MARREEKKIALILTGSSEPLTRSQVADYLGVSVSTVRRMEGGELHPTTDERGVRHFDPEEVLKVAQSIQSATVSQKGSGLKLSPGELAAEIFERFEQRHSLSEIVRELRLEPRKVRAMYHEWRTSLERAEQLRRHHPAPASSVQAYLESRKRIDQLLAELPEGQPTRISVALGGTKVWSKEFKQDVVIYDELGGFVTQGPLKPSDIRARFGEGQFRITAYSLVEHRVLWEVAAGV
ncbi:MAG: hypothetical protein MJE77_24260 [Proteobacteria bacterium]|nr:hypothetical protein [Pseudomonadota bacterium]